MNVKFDISERHNLGTYLKKKKKIRYVNENRYSACLSKEQDLHKLAPQILVIPSSDASAPVCCESVC